MRAAVLRERQVVREWRPRLYRFRKRESHRHYTRNQTRLPMEGDHFADDLAVRSEMMLPESVAEYHHASSILVKLLCGESRPQEWCHRQ